MTSAKFVFLVSVLLLIPQAAILATTDTADGSIAMASIIGFFGEYRGVPPWFLFAAAGCALATVLMSVDRYRLLLLLPQQFVLFIYAGGAIGAVMRESYADFVLRTWQFIASDQLFLVVIFVGHLMCMGSTRNSGRQ